ncbi:MAG: hypothetical protein LBN27_13445 [Prevotellaceae bacterium]|jgi:hypothetical protein|nr:hypothetical protein [Prevotellaceae bacterium]
MRKILFFTFVLVLLSSCGGRQKKDPSERVPPDSTRIVKVKPNINVYIENSGSMDGYVKGTTDFEMAVYNYLGDINISGVTDTLNLLYINSDTISFARAANADVIADFIQKLEPSTFKERGGNRGTSDIADVIKTVLRETRENDISILVTDGIFSPGKEKDATEYLINQEIGIKNTMANHLKKYPNTAVIVYQLSSKFNGTYYNKIDAKTTLTNEERPYYIWVIGETDNLAALTREVPTSKFNGSGIKHTFSIIAGNQKVDYAIKNGSGKFDVPRKGNDNKTIEDLKRDNTGKAKFAVNADFSKLLLDDEYLTNAANYEVSNTYDLMVKSRESKDKYTHSLNFAADKVRNGTLSVKLKTKLPEWVEEVNDDEGETAVAGKTYGIKYQLKGIYEAFTNKANIYTEIKINIQ